jgi:hypothetical protein
MSKKVNRPQSRRHIFVYDEDWEFLETNFGLTSQARIGTSATIREIIHKWVKHLKNKQGTEAPTTAEESVI